MLKISQKINYLLILITVSLLSACQTTLPVFEQDQLPSKSVIEDSGCNEQKNNARNVQYDLSLIHI